MVHILPNIHLGLNTSKSLKNIYFNLDIGNLINNF